MRPRNPTLRAIAAVLLVPLAAACDSDDVAPTDPVPDVLAGRWVATPECRPACEFSVTLTESPGQTISLLDPPISASIEVEVSTGGGFVLRAELYGLDFVSAGTARTAGSKIYITLPSGAVDTATYSISGSTLALDYQNELRNVDFDGDGQPDPGRVRAVLQRVSSPVARSR